jgi:ribosomal protein L29
MALPKYKDLEILKTLVEIDQEIFLLQKNLFDLRRKISSNNKMKSHLFTHYKHRIAQLNFKKMLFKKI